MSIIKTHDINLYGKSKDNYIRLRPLNDSHLPLLYKWGADPEIVYWTDDNDNDEGMTEESVQCIYGYVSPIAYCFLIEVNGEPVGDCWLEEMNIQEVSDMYPNLNVKRIDMTIGEKNWWGKGIGNAFVGMLTDYAFDCDNVDVIHIPGVFEFNIRSQKTFLRNGYKFVMATEGTSSKKVGQEYHYALKKAEWTPCYNITYERVENINNC